MKKELTKKEQKIEKRMGSKNIKCKNFKEEELSTYVVQCDMTQKEMDTIIEYQKKLPILQNDNENWINARDLHKELGVGRDFTTWIKQNIEDIELQENIEFSPSKGKTSKAGGRPTDDYKITVSVAKEIAMVAGVKGGRTSKELKSISKIARQYFIAIEHAYLARKEWNYDRADSLVCYPMCRKTPSFSYVDIRRFHRIYASN